MPQKRLYASNADKQRAYYERHPEVRLRNNHLAQCRARGLTVEQYAEMLAAQGGRCAICGKTPEAQGYRLAIDHDHETGENRGLLCWACNSGLGKLGDNVEGLEAALRYLAGQ